MKLDLGSGAHPAEGFEGVDIVDLGQAWVVDLDKPDWPWEDASVEALVSAHLVEHVGDLVAFMDEAWRILQPRGYFHIRHPFGWSDDAIADPTHRRQLVAKSWLYFDAAWRRAEGLSHYPIRADFELRDVSISRENDTGPTELSVLLRKR